MKKSTIIDALKERLDTLEQWRNKKETKGKKSKEDEEVCPNCGEDLQFVEDNIVLCPKCNEYFEMEEEKEDDK